MPSLAPEDDAASRICVFPSANAAASAVVDEVSPSLGSQPTLRLNVPKNISTVSLRLDLLVDFLNVSRLVDQK